MDKKPQTAQDARRGIVVDGTKGNLMFSALRSDRLERQPDIQNIQVDEALHLTSIAENTTERLE